MLEQKIVFAKEKVNLCKLMNGYINRNTFSVQENSKSVLLSQIFYRVSTGSLSKNVIKAQETFPILHDLEDNLVTF